MSKKDTKKENNAIINPVLSAKRVCLVNYLRGYSADLTDLLHRHFDISEAVIASGPNLAAVGKGYPGINHIEISYSRNGVNTWARFCCYIRLIFDNPTAGSFKRYSLIVIESHLDDRGRSCGLGPDEEYSISGHYDLTIYPGKKIPWFDLYEIKVVEEKEGPMIRSAIVFDTLKSFRDAGRLENFMD